jgi:hypothetical protein
MVIVGRRENEPLPRLVKSRDKVAEGSLRDERIGPTMHPDAPTGGDRALAQWL